MIGVPIAMEYGFLSKVLETPDDVSPLLPAVCSVIPSLTSTPHPANRKKANFAGPSPIGK